MTHLAQIRASEIMQTKVAKLSPSDSIETAIALLESMQIGGAPVVDASGAIVGVLSARDVAQTAHVRSGHIEVDRSDYVLADQDTDCEDPYAGEQAILAKEGFSPGVEPGELVGDWMTPEIVSVTPDTTLKSLCRLMAENRVHRVFVIEKRKLCGVITSFDVVRCVALEA